MHERSSNIYCTKSHCGTGCHSHGHASGIGVLSAWLRCHIGGARASPVYDDLWRFACCSPADTSSGVFVSLSVGAAEQALQKDWFCRPEGPLCIRRGSMDMGTCSKCSEWYSELCRVLTIISGSFIKRSCLSSLISELFVTWKYFAQYSSMILWHRKVDCLVCIRDLLCI